MKKIIGILLLIFLCGCSCRKFSSEQIEIEVVGIPTAEEIKFVLHNNSDYTCEYGTGFYIEVYKDDEWKIFNPKQETFFTLMAYDLRPGEKKEFIINLDTYELLPDKYRLIKSIDCSDNLYEFNKYIEFEIE